MIRVFVDFDGTITKRDVGDVMFEEFGGARAVGAVSAYRAGSLSAADCFRQECDACGEFSAGRLDKFLDAQEIDGTFVQFARFCRENGLALTILSDGMDYYIRRILDRHGLADVESFSNTLELLPSGDDGNVRMHPVFPYQDETCDRCASCKRNHMLTRSSDEDILVYVGEGYSDRCPVRFADLVFAKDELPGYCRQEGIPFQEYRTFEDVRTTMEKFLGDEERSRQKGLRPRRQARLARSEILSGG